MYLISNFVLVLKGCLSMANLNVLSQISKSILIATGKITMLEISRTTNKSYRTIQRFYALINIVWDKLNMLLFKQYEYDSKDTYLIVSDETIEKKAGKHTHGISYFFSNLFKATVPSVAFMALSIVSINKRKSFPLAIEQVVKNKTVAPTPTVPSKEKRPKGRPKGSKNKPKAESTDIQYLVLANLLKAVFLSFVGTLGFVPAAYLVLDGYFGNQYYIKLAKQYKLHLISKLKSTAALYLPYDGQYCGHGRKTKYGKKVKFNDLDSTYLVKSLIEDKVLYQYYQMFVWNKSITDCMLNVVIITAKDLTSGKICHCNLFTTDMTLTCDKIVDYYSLRFQIEFNFRDAKQYFGLADFKNYKETQVTNAANISFFMCNVATIEIELFKERYKLENMSILDLKAYYRAEKIGNEVLKLKNQGKKAHQFLNPEEIFELAKFQSVNF